MQWNGEVKGITNKKVYDLNIGEKAIQLNCCGGEHVDNSYTITRNVGL